MALEAWLVVRAEVDQRPGGSVRSIWTTMEGTGRFVEIDPPRRLVLELTPAATGTQLRLTQTGFGEEPDWDDLYDGLDPGWDRALANLRDWRETGIVKTQGFKDG